MKNGISFNLIKYIEERVKDFVTKAELAPVRMVAYGIASLIGLAVVGFIIKFFIQ